MENEKVPDEKDLTSISSSNMSELLSTNNEEKTESNDTLPTSSTDASTTFKTSNLVSDDPISSTSSEMETIKSKSSIETKEVVAGELNQTIFQPIDDADLLDISMSKEPDEKIEEIDDLVNDLETLLGEPAETFTLSYKSNKNATESTDKQTECFELDEQVLPENEVTSNTTINVEKSVKTTEEEHELSKKPLIDLENCSLPEIPEVIQELSTDKHVAVIDINKSEKCVTDYVKTNEETNKKCEKLDVGVGIEEIKKVTEENESLRSDEIKETLTENVSVDMKEIIDKTVQDTVNINSEQDKNREGTSSKADEYIVEKSASKLPDKEQLNIAETEDQKDEIIIENKRETEKKCGAAIADVEQVDNSDNCLQESKQLIVKTVEKNKNELIPNIIETGPGDRAYGAEEFEIMDCESEKLSEEISLKETLDILPPVLPKFLLEKAEEIVHLADTVALNEDSAKTLQACAGDLQDANKALESQTDEQTAESIEKMEVDEEITKNQEKSNNAIAEAQISDPTANEKEPATEENVVEILHKDEPVVPITEKSLEQESISKEAECLSENAAEPTKIESTAVIQPEETKEIVEKAKEETGKQPIELQKNVESHDLMQSKANQQEESDCKEILRDVKTTDESPVSELATNEEEISGMAEIEKMDCSEKSQDLPLENKSEISECITQGEKNIGDAEKMDCTDTVESRRSQEIRSDNVELPAIPSDEGKVKMDEKPDIPLDPEVHHDQTEDSVKNIENSSKIDVEKDKKKTDQMEKNETVHEISEHTEEQPKNIDNVEDLQVPNVSDVVESLELQQPQIPVSLETNQHADLAEKFEKQNEACVVVLANKTIIPAETKLDEALKVAVTTESELEKESVENSDSAVCIVEGRSSLNDKSKITDVNDTIVEHSEEQKLQELELEVTVSVERHKTNESDPMGKDNEHIKESLEIAVDKNLPEDSSLTMAEAVADNKPSVETPSTITPVKDQGDKVPGTEVEAALNEIVLESEEPNIEFAVIGECSVSRIAASNKKEQFNNYTYTSNLEQTTTVSYLANKLQEKETKSTRAVPSECLESESNDTLEPLEQEAEDEEEEEQDTNPFFDINVRRKTVEQDLRNIVCLSEESSSDSEGENVLHVHQPVNNSQVSISSSSSSRVERNKDVIYDVSLMKELPPNQEESDLIQIAKEVEELQSKTSIPDITTEESLPSVDDILLAEQARSNVVNVPLIQTQESSFGTILDTSENKLSENELREIEAIRRAVASITDSSQDTYDSYLGDNSATIDNCLPDDMPNDVQHQAFSEVSNNAVDAGAYLNKIDRVTAIHQQVIEEKSSEGFKEDFLQKISPSITIEKKEAVESPFKSITVTTELRPGLQITPIQIGSQHSNEPEMVIEKIPARNVSKPTIDDKENLVNTENSLLFKNIDEQNDMEVETVNEKPARNKTKKSNKIIEPLSINVDEYERSYSPKVTIKPLKIPDEEVSTTSETELNKGSLKMTITKQSDKMHSVVKMVRVNDDLSPAKFLEQDSMRKSVSKQQLEQQHSPKTTRSSRIHSPTMQQRCGSPRITIKPIVEPKNESIKITFRSIKPEEPTKRHSPKIKTVKPSEKSEEVSNDEEMEEIKSRIVLKINKGNLQTPEKETRKREYPDDDKLEKLQKIKLKFSGGHPHIVQDGADENHKKIKKDSGLSGNPGFKYAEECSIKRLSDEKLPEKMKKFKSSSENDLDGYLKHNSSANESNSTYKEELRLKVGRDSTMETKRSESDSKYLLKISELASRTDHIQANPVVTVGVVTPTTITPPAPKKRGRPRKVPLEVREELKDVFNESQESLQSTPSASPSSSIGTPEPCSSSAGGRPKRSCRGQNVIATLGIKPRKPRGAGKGRGSKVNMGERLPSDSHLELVQTAVMKPEKELKPSKAKLKLMQKEAEEFIQEKSLHEPQPSTSKQADLLENSNIEDQIPVTVIQQRIKFEGEQQTLTNRLEEVTSDPDIIIIDDDSQSSFNKDQPKIAVSVDANLVKTEQVAKSDNIIAEKELNDGAGSEVEEEVNAGGHDSEEDRRKELVRQKKLEAIKKCRAKRMEKLAKAAEIKRKREEQAKMRREAKIAAEEAERVAVKSRANKRYGRYGNPKPQISLIDEPVLESGGTVKSQKNLFNPLSKEMKSESMSMDEDTPTTSQSNLDQSLPSTSSQKFISESMIVETEDGGEIRQTIRTDDIVMMDEETRMSADLKGSRAQTPIKHVPQADAAIDDSQGSTGGTTTMESTTSRSRTKASRSEIHHHDANANQFIADQLAEYYWNGQGPFMLQEQVAQFLGIKSFKRKYPNIQRRAVEMQERDYLKENGLATEAQCDLGLTVVNGQDILDIMYSDFQDKYEDYCKVQRERQARELANKQKALTQQALKPGYEKLDIIEQAVQSAAQWNKQFNKARREHRKASMDLQSFIIHYPQLKIKPLPTPKPGNYPLALVPGQFTDYYKEYTATELNNLPLNTMCYDEIKVRRYESESDDSGSESDTDSDSSSTSSSSDSSKDGGGKSEDCKECSNNSIDDVLKINGKSEDNKESIVNGGGNTIIAVASGSGIAGCSSVANSTAST